MSRYDICKRCGHYRINHVENKLGQGTCTATVTVHPLHKCHCVGFILDVLRRNDTGVTYQQ